MLLVAGVSGGSAAAADTPSPAVSAQGVRIILPGGDEISLPAAQIPGTAQVSAAGWSSSADQPAVQVGDASSVVSLTREGANGRVQLSGLTLFGGEVTLGSMAFAASHSSRSSGSDLAAEQLVIEGAAVSVPAAGSAPVPIGEWGQLTADVGLQDGGSELIGLRVELLADHGGLPAGSEIQIGVVAFPPTSPTGGEQQPDHPPPTLKHHPARHRPRDRSRARHHAPRHVDHPSHLPRLGHGVRARVVRAAAAQLGWPYLWGGESRAEGGFDCSGLVDYAYAAAGHPFPGRPTAAVLWRMGIPIDRSHLRPGDLTFLGARSGMPYHVGLYAGGGVVIVASGRGEPIAAVRLESVPWDGFARVWAAGSKVPLRAEWLTAASRSARLRLGLRTDPVAAGRLSPPPAYDGGRVPHPKRPPAPPAPKRQTPSAATIADMRVRVAPGRPVGPLPSA
jgi:cell wall-associated NlpC family hydrolase